MRASGVHEGGGGRKENMRQFLMCVSVFVVSCEVLKKVNFLPCVDGEGHARPPRGPAGEGAASPSSATTTTTTTTRAGRS